MESNHVNRTKEAFGVHLDRVITDMRQNGQSEARMHSHIGMYEINLLTSMISLVDRPDEELIAPEHKPAYDQCRQIAREVFKEKGFQLLEY